MTDGELTGSFTLLVRGEVSDDVIEQIYERADDFTVSVGRDGSFARIGVDRDDDSVLEVIVAAIDDVEEAAPNLCVERVEPDELVYASEIAERIGRSRQSVDHLIRGVRGPGDFPAPLSHASARNPLWRWSDVESWFASYEGRTVDERVQEQQDSIALVNAMLDLRRSLSSLPPHAAEHAKRVIMTKLLKPALGQPAKIRISKDFDAPLPDDLERAFRGEE
jgi:predicted DNA-binding transcriptional regulator AlpA